MFTRVISRIFYEKPDERQLDTLLKKLKETGNTN